MSDDRNSKINEVDEDILKRKPIKKMYVDPRGLHCFFLAEHEIFYNHWTSPRVFQVLTKSSLNSADSSGTQPKAFRSIDLQYVSPKDYDTFEILLGTEDGQIFHACIQSSPKGLDMVDPVKLVFDTMDYRPIVDIKVAKIAGNQVVLAITDHALH